MLSNPKSKISPPPTVVNLDRDKLTFCDNKSATILTFPYPPGSIKDMEIVSHETLVTQLKAFLDTHKISPTHIVFVLSPSIYFEKSLAHLSEEDRADQTHKFIDMIPFGSVSSKMFHIGNDFKLVAINRDFYESIKTAFEKSGFTVSAVVPNFVLGSLGLKDDFNIEACRLILKKMDFVMENSFLTPDESQETLAVSRHFIQQHQGLFAALSLLFVGLAGFTAFVTLRRPTPPRPVSAQIKNIATPSPSPQAVPTDAPEATPAASLTVNILNASETPGLASELETELISLGFANIQTGNATVSATNTLVIYSPKVPHSLRDLLGDSLEKFFTSYSAQENPDSEFDITITAGTPKQ